ncbi:MAG: hypothetical protein IJ191_05035 [Treponema sp.]|nr:hypothetical protein [Treponema sp.]
MTTQKAIVSVVLICAALCIVYLFAAARPLGSEYQLEPEWNVMVSPQVSPPAAHDTLISYKLGQTIGYFTPDGKITSFTSFPFKAAISNTYYAPYTADSSSVTFYTTDGTATGQLSVAGFPYFADDRIYVFLPGGNAFSRCAADGTVLWTYRRAVPITAFASSAGGTIAGYADGSIHSFTADGTLDHTFSPGGSDYPVVLGAALSPSGTYLASISGRNRQRFVLAQKDGGQIKIIKHFFLPADDAQQKLVQFSADGKNVYYATTDEFGIVSVDGKQHETIPVPGQVLSVREIADGAFVLSKTQERYTVTFIESFGTFAGSFSFSAQTAFIQTAGNMLFVGRDTTISRISVNKR